MNDFISTVKSSGGSRTNSRKNDIHYNTKFITNSRNCLQLMWKTCSDLKFGKTSRTGEYTCFSAFFGFPGGKETDAAT